MRTTRIMGVTLIVSVAVAGLWGEAFNMPMFARKYDIACGTCHTVVPKLSKMGMDFRAAGFRMPEDIGAEDKSPNDISTQTSTRIQTRYDAHRTEDNGVKTDRSRLNFHEVTFYPLTGAFNKNYASLVELSIAPEEPVEIENAYVRGDWKSGQGFVSGRVGIFHPFEGYGASDRPLSISRPLFQITPANFNQSTFFTPWNFDESGLELGWNQGPASLRGTVFSGISFDPEENIAHPAQVLTGTFARNPSRSDFHNTDFQLFGNYVLTPGGGGISAYYYNGAVDLPIGGVADTSAFFKDKFDRVAGYASYPIVSKVLLLAGAQTGQDKTWDLGAGDFGPKSRSTGYFGEADLDLGHEMWLGARYDWFDPTDKKDDNEILAGTVALNKPWNNGLQLITQYQRRQTKRGLLEDRKEDDFQARLIWIW